MSKCVIGTRGSKLALWQANFVKDRLEEAWPGLECELRVVKTTGDIVLDRPLHEVGDKAMFTKELESALLSREIDLCVHSMKDVPTSLPEGCRIAGMLERADARDVLVCGPALNGAKSLADLPRGARIGTGSLRRSAQLKARFPHLEPKPIRGNVDTRLAKACGPDYDAVVLAAAGVERMGELAQISAYLGIEEMVPAAGQGAIGIEALDGDERICSILEAVSDSVTQRCVEAERRVLSAMGGSCKVPVGVHVRHEDGLAVLDAVVLSLDGAERAGAHSEAPIANGVEMALARAAVDALEQRGARGILEVLLGEGA